MAAVLQSPVADPMLLVEQSGGVATLTLNRPAQYNVLSAGMMDALQAEFERIAADPAVRVVVLAAAGKAFCAGHDLREMRAEPALAYYQALFAQCSRLMTTLQALPQPVIARVQGVATAAGCQLVAMCDLADDFVFPEGESGHDTKAAGAARGMAFGASCAPAHPPEHLRLALVAGEPDGFGLDRPDPGEPEPQQPGHPLGAQIRMNGIAVRSLVVIARQQSVAVMAHQSVGVSPDRRFAHARGRPFRISRPVAASR